MLSKSKRLYLSKEFDIKDPLEKDGETFIEELCKRACINERFLGSGISRMVFDLGEGLILKVNTIYGKYATKCNGNGVDIEQYLIKSDSPLWSRYTPVVVLEEEDLPIPEDDLEGKDIDELTDFFFKELTEDFNDQTCSEVSNSKDWRTSNIFAKVYGHSKNYSAVVMEKCIPYDTICDFFSEGIAEATETPEISVIKSFYKEKGWNIKEPLPLRKFINKQRRDIEAEYKLKDLHMGNFGISMDGDFKIFDYAL